MKLHKDGTLEGTPQEIAEYKRLTMNELRITTGTINTKDVEDKLRGAIDKNKIYTSTSRVNGPVAKYKDGFPFNAIVINEGYQEHILQFEDN